MGDVCIRGLLTRIYQLFNMRFHLCLYLLTISLHLISIFGKDHKHKHKRLSLLTCPCDADKLCSKSSKGYAICNCWTKCNYECPQGFDRIDETTENCKYGDTRNQCSTTIICQNNKKNKKEKKSKPSSSSSATKNSTAEHNHLIGKTEADSDD